MRLQPLRTYDLPDVSDHLIHFTGRIGPKMAVDSVIENLQAQERVARILVDGVVHGFETFGSATPVVCFTESTKQAVPRLLQQGRYEPCGIAFSKQFVFDNGGGPALYVRGDEWEAATQGLPQPIRARMVRFWPGAILHLGEYLPGHLASPSEWLHEREWRIAGDLRFAWRHVEFLIVPDVRWQDFYADWIADWAGDEYAEDFARIPAVVMNQRGDVLHDPVGIWL